MLDVLYESEITSAECAEDDTSAAIQILGYRDAETYYATDRSGKRSIYIDEIENDEGLRAKV